MLKTDAESCIVVRPIIEKYYDMNFTIEETRDELIIINYMYGKCPDQVNNKLFNDLNNVIGGRR